MPKRYTKTLGAFCDELGMSPQTASEFLKDTLKYLKSKHLSVPTIEDEEIGPNALQFLFIWLTLPEPLRSTNVWKRAFFLWHEWERALGWVAA